MTIKHLYPNARPSLDFRFARDKRLDPRITFSRASTGTYFDANGVLQSAPAGVARFDHNPVSGESLGLLMEEAGTNFVLHSKNVFNDTGAEELRWSIIDATVAGWPVPGHGLGGIGVGTHTPSAAIAPDGSLTAAYFSAVGDNYLRSPRVTIGNNGQELNALIVNLSTGMIVSASPTASPASITSVGSGWYRISWNGRNTLIGGTSTASIYAKAGVTDILKLSFYPFFGGMCMALQTGGTTGQGVYVWGAQIEAGTFLTSYIPTTSSTVTRAADTSTSSTVTRAADVASIPASPYLYGTFLARYKHQPPSGLYRQIFSVGAANAYTAFVCRTEPTSTVGIVLPGITDIRSTANTETSGFNNVATTRVLGDYAVCLNGGTVAKSSITTNQTDNSVITFMYGTIATNSGGTISRFTYYPQRLQDSTLQKLTE